MVRVLSLVAGACLTMHVTVHHVISDVHSKEATLGISFTLINTAMIGLLVIEVVRTLLNSSIFNIFKIAEVLCLIPVDIGKSV